MYESLSLSLALSDAEEMVLIEWIDKVIRLGFPPRPELVRAKAQSIVLALGLDKPSIGYC